MNGPHELDPRLHDYLDGELSDSEAHAFEGDLRPGSTLGNQLESLKHLRAWFRATRPRAPSNLFRTVEIALERELAPRDRVPASGSFPSSPRRLPRIRPRLDWVWIPAAAAVAVILVTQVPGRRDGGLPPAADRALKQEPSHTPPPTIQTSRSVASGDAVQNTVRYVFTVKADRAREICLAGDFNYWKVCDARLRRVGEDLWSIAIDLPRGRHEYMFVVDGRWVTDPSAMGYVEDGFGNRNALLVI